MSNTDSKRATDRSTITERQQSRDLAVNTEPKIMYSKDVGDFDVRVNSNEQQREYHDEQEFTWSTLHGRRAPSSTTYERTFQKDLIDTQREVGVVPRPSKQREETVEELRQELITFRSPQQSTEESYETTVIRDAQPSSRQFDEMRKQTKHEEVDTTIVKSEMTEWTRSLGGSAGLKSSLHSPSQPAARPRTPEELVEESYEVVSTLTQPSDVDFAGKSSSARGTLTSSTQKAPSSEDESSYCEEWTVTEAKRKQDGQTVKTIIDR